MSKLLMVLFLCGFLFQATGCTAHVSSNGDVDFSLTPSPPPASETYTPWREAEITARPFRAQKMACNMTSVVSEYSGYYKDYGSNLTKINPRNNFAIDRAEFLNETTGHRVDRISYNGQDSLKYLWLELTPAYNDDGTERHPVWFQHAGIRVTEGDNKIHYRYSSCRMPVRNGFGDIVDCNYWVVEEEGTVVQHLTVKLSPLGPVVCRSYPNCFFGAVTSYRPCELSF